MYRPMKQRELVRLVEQRGFSLVRSNGRHLMYGRAGILVAVPKSYSVSSGVVRQILATIERLVRHDQAY